MRLEIVIRVSEEKLVVEVPEKGWRKEFANCLTLSEHGTILSVGKSETELQEITRQKGLKEMSDLKFLPIYDTESFDLDFFSQSFQFFTGNAQDETKSSMFWLFDRIELKVWLPENYGSVLGDVHQLFEYILQERLRLNSLEINGILVGWPVWQRKLVQFYSIIPIMFTFFAFLWLLPVTYPINRTWISTIFNQMAEPWNTIGTVLNFLSTFVLLGLLWGGFSVLLLVLYRFFVPETLFLLHQASFPSRGGIGEKYLIWLAERILVDDPIFSPKTS